MIKAIFGFFFILTTLVADGQTLFFENLKTTTWVSYSSINEATLENMKRLPLWKLEPNQDSTYTNTTHWFFEDHQVKIFLHQPINQFNSLLCVLPYNIVQSKNIIQLELSNSKKVNFKVGITSTGHYAFLSRYKRQLKPEFH